MVKVNDALAINSKYVPALNVLGDIDFEKADFTAAAEAYRHSLTFEPKQKAIAARYATSLAASLPAPEAATRYSEWLNSVPPAAPDLDWFMAEEVGLKLLAGDAATAKSFEQTLVKRENADIPLVQARLGWWYYRANNAQTAADLIGLSVEQRPQIGSLSAKLGWALAAQKKYETAQQRFYAANSDGGRDTRAEAQMGLAVTAWEAKEPDLALINYRAAILSAQRGTIQSGWLLYTDNQSQPVCKQFVRRTISARKLKVPFRGNSQINKFSILAPESRATGL